MKTLWITFIITVMLGFVIEVNMIPFVNQAVTPIVTPTYNANVVSVSQLIPLVAIIILIIDAVLSIDDHRDK